MPRVHVAVGSNIEPGIHVPSGLARLHARFPIKAASRFYVTSAIGRPEQPSFWNGIVVVDVGRSDRRQVREALRAVESEEGRRRGPDKWAARELDLDVLYWDSEPVGSASDDLRRRAFLRWCLADLTGEPVETAGPVAPYAWP